jgi:hypothetical protein
VPRGRRRGFDYDLRPPGTAIDPSEHTVSIDATNSMRETFAEDGGAVLAFFDALTGGGQRKQ